MDKEGASAMAVVLLCITLAMFVVQKYYLERKTAATLTGKASRARMLIEDKSVTIPLTLLCSLGALFVIMMYICVPIGALFPTWGYKFTPLTFKWFQQVFTRYHGLQAFRDSFVLSLIASPITALLSMIISYLIVKRNFRSKGFIEAVSILAMAHSIAFPFPGINPDPAVSPQEELICGSPVFCPSVRTVREAGISG
jgi:iron(III) transport system permease protein